MKRIVVCALLASAFLFTASPIRAQPTTSDATVVLKKFYDWYLRLPNHNWDAHLDQVKSLFDPGLYTMLQTILHREARAHEEIMDFDVFVNAQWDAVAYAFGTPTAKNSSVNVPVKLTLSARELKTKLTVVLRKNAGGEYVIYDVIYDNAKSTLRGLLRTWLKE